MKVNRICSKLALAISDAILSSRSHVKDLLRSFRARLVLACSLGLLSVPAHGQGFTVQLPTHGTFSIQTSVSVPDGGEMNLGGNVRYGAGTTRRGGARAFGSSYGSSNASVKATIIDLDELDRLIRSEANVRPIPVDWSTVPPPKVGNDLNHDSALPDRPPAYAYMMAMSTTSKTKKSSIEDARYYLSLANDAKRRGHWTSVELYYQMAWDALPEHRKKIATDAILKAKELQAEAKKNEKLPRR